MSNDCSGENLHFSCRNFFSIWTRTSSIVNFLIQFHVKTTKTTSIQLFTDNFLEKKFIHYTWTFFDKHSAILTDIPMIILSAEGKFNFNCWVNAIFRYRSARILFDWFHIHSNAMTRPNSTHEKKMQTTIQLNWIDQRVMMNDWKRTEWSCSISHVLVS